MGKKIILEVLAVVILILILLQISKPTDKQGGETNINPVDPNASAETNTSVTYYVENHAEARKHLQECRNTPLIKNTARCVNVEFATRIIGIND